MTSQNKDNKILYIILGVVIYIFIVFLAIHCGNYMDANPDSSIIVALGPALDALTEDTFNVFPISKTAYSYIFSFSLIFAFFALWIYVENEKNKRTMPGKEKGTAKWLKNIKKYNKKYTEPFDSPTSEGANNMILTQEIFLSMNGRKTRRNNNVLVVGGSGSGKSRFFVKPNLLQANCNFVVTDPKGELLASQGKALEAKGYEVKVFNLIDMRKSCCYNPFDYIRDDLGVLMMINCLIRNTNPPGQTTSDPFWEKSETALLQALCFYLIKHRPKEEHNFTNVMKLLRAAEVDEANPNKKSALDILFDQVAQKDPYCISLNQYRTFKMGAGRTLKSILISCAVRLTVFNLQQIENLTSKDTIALEELGSDKPVALFVIIPAADSTYNFLVSMMYSQLFETLYHKCETNPMGFTPCPRHIRFLLDEFVNIGQIPEFTKKLSTMRQYEISCSIILQNLAQIKTMYKDDWETIVGNCDSFLFLGGQEYSTLDYISKDLGDMTIVTRNNSRSRGRSGSSSLSFNRDGRKLMFADEIMRMPKDECILIINGMDPYKGKKYEYTKHPRYNETGDANEEFIYINKFDNFVSQTTESIEMKHDQKQISLLKSARENPTPQTKLVTGTKSMKGLCATLNLNEKNIRSRLVILPPTDAGAFSETADFRTERELIEFDEGFIVEENKPIADIDLFAIPNSEKHQISKEIEDEEEVTIDIGRKEKEAEVMQKENREQEERDAKTITNEEIPISKGESFFD